MDILCCAGLVVTSTCVMMQKVLDLVKLVLSRYGVVGDSVAAMGNSVRGAVVCYR